MRAIDTNALKRAINKDKALRQYLDCGHAKSWLIQTIDEQPTIQLDPQWTPCSEGLPKAKQKVLVQYADGSMATKRCNDEGHLQWFYANAVAWMPAPEPWGGDAE